MWLLMIVAHAACLWRSRPARAGIDGWIADRGRRMHEKEMRKVETNRGGEGRKGKGRKTVYPFLRARNFHRKSACSPQPLQRGSSGNLQQVGSPVPTPGSVLGRPVVCRHRNSKAHPANKRASGGGGGIEN